MKFKIEIGALYWNGNL